MTQLSWDIPKGIRLNLVGTEGVNELEREIKASIIWQEKKWDHKKKLFHPLPFDLDQIFNISFSTN